MLTYFLLCILEKKNFFLKEKQLKFSRMLDLFKEIILTGNELSNLLESMGKEPYNEDRSKYYLNVFFHNFLHLWNK